MSEVWPEIPSDPSSVRKSRAQPERECRNNVGDGPNARDQNASRTIYDLAAGDRLWRQKNGNTLEETRGFSFVVFQSDQATAGRLNGARFSQVWYRSRFPS